MVERGGDRNLALQRRESPESPQAPIAPPMHCARRTHRLRNITNRGFQSLPRVRHACTHP